METNISGEEADILDNAETDILDYEETDVSDEWETDFSDTSMIEVRKAKSKPKFRCPQVAWRRSGRRRMPTSIFKLNKTPPRKRPTSNSSLSRRNLQTRGRSVERRRENLITRRRSVANPETLGRSEIRRNVVEFFRSYSY